jgi:hypothetical protein
MFIAIIYAADASTLIKVAINERISIPLQSIQYTRAEGTPMLRYSLRSWSVSLVKKKKLDCRSFYLMQMIVTDMKLLE